MQILCFDAETFYAPDYTLRKMTTESYIRDSRFKCHGAGLKINNGPSVWVTGRLLPKVLSKINWEETILLGHNLHFDGFILEYHYGYRPKRYVDTLGMSRALIGQHLVRHGLEYVSAELVQLHKMDGLAQSMGVRDLSPEQERKLADYCVRAPHWNPHTQRMEAGDTELTWAIFRKMAPHFPKREYYALDWVTRKFVQPRLQLDSELLVQYLEEVRTNKQVVLEDVYYRLTIPDFKYYVHHESDCVFRASPNDEHDGLVEEIERKEYLRIRSEGNYQSDEITAEQQEGIRKILASAPQYAAALESLGVTPPTKINKKGQVTFAFAKTDEAHKALLEYDSPTATEEQIAQVQALVAARLEVKSTIEETRAEKYLDASAHGEWPVDYNYSGAKNTHRLSGGKGGGGNPTNLKRGGTLRKAIMAPEGKILLVADLAQIECRMVLWLGMQMPRSNGGEKEALRIMAEGGDLYSHFGSLMYGRPINKKEHPLERQIAKSAVLGLGFGMGPGRFMDYCLSSGIRIAPTLAESAVALYRNTYAGVKQYWMVLDKVMKSAVYDGLENIRYPVSLQQLPISKVVRDPLFGHVSLQSPSGLLLKYPDLSWDSNGEGTYRDGATRVKIFGGKFVENEVQHLCRNILVGDMLPQIDPVYPVDMSTYDELVMEVDDDPEAIRIADEFVQRIMTQEHPLYPGLPLGVETGYHKRYGEAKN